MPAFRVSGATGQAPTTAWFGSALPDRGLTMTLQGYWNNQAAGGSGNFPGLAGFLAANFISNWVPWNTLWNGGANAVSISLGAAVTAPDGTMTANKIVESTTNSQHMMVAVYPSSSQSTTKRFAVIAAAGERTRMVCALCTAAGANELGCRAVFDLAGGQIGVASAGFGADGFGGQVWDPVRTSIQSLGMFGGKTWYLCIMDVASHFTVLHPFYAEIGIDAGSGTGAINASYAGNGSSGIYVWKANLLPPRAWGLQTVSFFDDFASLATVDINNTKAPSFNWYLNNAWPPPGFGAPPNGIFPSPVPPSAISLSSPSVLKQDGAWLSGSGGSETLVQSAATTGTGTFVGWTFQTPLLIEFRNSFPVNSPSNAPAAAAFYAVSLEFLLNPSNEAPGPGPPTYPTPYSEIDMPEEGPLTDALGGQLSIIQGDDGGPGGGSFTPSYFTESLMAVGAYEVWYSLRTYSVGNVVGFNSLLYQALGTTTGNQPDISPGQWSIFTPGGNMPTVGNTVVFDNTLQHTNSTLWLNDNSKYNSADPGEFLAFYNDVMACSTGQNFGYLTYSSTQGLNNNGTFVPSDSRHMVIRMNSGPHVFFLDFVRITK